MNPLTATVVGLVATVLILAGIIVTTIEQDGCWPVTTKCVGSWILAAVSLTILVVTWRSMYRTWRARSVLAMKA